jgi:hypothetical protein
MQWSCRVYIYNMYPIVFVALDEEMEAMNNVIIIDHW